MLNGYLDPVWNIDAFKNLAYKQDTIKTSYQLNEYNESGHALDNMRLYNYFEPNPMPAGVNLVKQHFANKFDYVTIAVNLFVPGTYVPCHNDLYQRYKTVNNLSDDKDIYRFIVMLEDGKNGQMLQINNKLYHLWKSGDYFGWKNNDLHASYNMSTSNRYALQVTAVG